MTITAPSVPNEVAESVAGQVSELAPSQVAAVSSLSTITPSQTFNFMLNSQTLQFSAGVTQPVRPEVLAALTAANAPFTTP